LYNEKKLKKIDVNHFLVVDNNVLDVLLIVDMFQKLQFQILQFQNNNLN